MNEDLTDNVDSKRGLLNYQQPSFHQEKKGFFESIFGSLIKTYNYDLNHEEIQYFKELQSECNDEKTQKIIRFDQENSDHNKLLTSLYFAFTEEEILEENLEGEFWVKYGFQQKNPRTDFRSAGIIAAKHILQFVEKNKDLVLKEMMSKSYFFFAIYSIKVSDFLMQYFHIPEKMSENSAYPTCTRKALKNFCRLLRQDSLVLYEFHEIFLKHLFYTHENMIKKLDFQTFLTISDKEKFEKTQNRLIQTLEYKKYKNFEEFERFFWGRKYYEEQRKKND